MQTIVHLLRIVNSILFHLPKNCFIYMYWNAKGCFRTTSLILFWTGNTFSSFFWRILRIVALSRHTVSSKGWWSEPAAGSFLATAQFLWGMIPGPIHLLISYNRLKPVRRCECRVVVLLLGISSFRKRVPKVASWPQGLCTLNKLTMPVFLVPIRLYFSTSHLISRSHPPFYPVTLPCSIFTEPHPPTCLLKRSPY